jgi:hypothetical protein
MFLVPGTLGGSNPRYKQFFGLIFAIVTVDSAQWGREGGKGGGRGGRVGTFIIYIDDYRI